MKYGDGFIGARSIKTAFSDSEKGYAATSSAFPELRAVGSNAGEAVRALAVLIEATVASMPVGSMTDAQHATVVTLASSRLNTAMSYAATAGLRIECAVNEVQEISVNVGIVRVPVVGVAVARPL